MQRMLAKRTTQRVVTGGTDGVVYGVSLPGGSVIHDIRASMSYVSAIIDVAFATMVAIEAWILPVHDPDSQDSFENIWDKLVPKDTDIEVIDEDTQASDTAPFYEPGEPDWTQMFDVGLRPRKIYGFYDLLTIADGALSINRDPATPFALEWAPGRMKRIRIRKRFRVSQPSVLLFALGVPQLNDTTTVAESALAENEWNRAKYIKDVVYEALRHLYGLTEAGAETPWEEATALLKKLLEPDILEVTGDFFTSVSFDVVGKLAVDMSVPGALEGMLLTTGRG